MGEGGLRLLGRGLYGWGRGGALHGFEGRPRRPCTRPDRPLAPHGVTVNAVAPALVQDTGTIPGDDEDSRQQLASLIPVGRLGQPEEVAQIVRAIIENPYITAQTFSVDGGMHPR